MDFQTLNLLFRCSKEYSHERIHPKELSDTECMICSYVYAHPACTQEEAASALRTDKTTVAKAIAALEEKNCLKRDRDAADKRKNRLTLTDAGTEKIAPLAHVHDEWLAEVMQCLSPEEQLRFESYCRRLLIAAEAIAEKRKNGGSPHAL